MVKPNLKITVYKCPFCKADIWFSYTPTGKGDFCRHIHKEHYTQLIEYIATHSAKQVIRTALKWCVKV